MAVKESEFVSLSKLMAWSAKIASSYFIILISFQENQTLFFYNILVINFLYPISLFILLLFSSTNFPNFPNFPTTFFQDYLLPIYFSVELLCKFPLLRKRNNNSPEKSTHFPTTFSRIFYFFRKGTPLSFIYFSGLPLYQLPFLRRPVLRGSSLHVNSSMTSLGTHNSL